MSKSCRPDGECGYGCDCSDEPPKPEPIEWAPAYGMFVFKSDRKPCPNDMVMGTMADAVIGTLYGIREEL